MAKENLIWRGVTIDRYALEGSLSQVIEALTAEFNRLPPEATNPTLDISAYAEYGPPVVEVKIRYYSPETEDERVRREQLVKRNEEYQRKQYETLKKKFGGI